MVCDKYFDKSLVYGSSTFQHRSAIETIYTAWYYVTSGYWAWMKSFPFWTLLDNSLPTPVGGFVEIFLCLHTEITGVKFDCRPVIYVLFTPVIYSQFMRFQFSPLLGVHIWPIAGYEYNFTPVFSVRTMQNGKLSYK